MKLMRFAGIVLLGMLSSACLAATSTVTATVTDTDGQLWSNGTWNAKVLMPGGQFSGQTPTVGGVAIPTSINGVMNASGALSASLTDTSTIDQSGVQWTITVCPNASVSPYGTTTCFAYTGPIVGASVSLTSRFSSATAPRFPAGAQAFGYLDAEVFPPAQPGLSYFNTNTNLTLAGLRLWDGNRWVAGGGSGGGGTPTGAAGGVLSGTYPNPGMATGAAVANIGYTPAASPTLASGAHVRYDMLPSHITGGNTLVDQSGNAINATFNASAPTSNAYGINMTSTQGVALDAALLTDRTWVSAFYSSPLNGAVDPANGLNLMGLITPNDTAGLALYYNTAGQIGQGTPTIANNSAIIGVCPVQVIGYTKMVWIRGTNSTTDPDRIFINGTKCNMTTNTATVGLKVTGNFFLGAATANAYATRGFTGSIYFLESFAAAFTDAQAQAETIAIDSQIAGRGAAIAPPVLNISTPFLMADSDSIDFGTGTSAGNNTTAWFARLNLINQPAYTLYNFGIPGLFQTQILQSANYREGAYCKDQRGPAIIIDRGGVNDLLNGYTVAQTFTAFAGVVGALKGTNCSIYIGTTVSANTGGVTDTKVQQLNALLRSSWKVMGAKGLIDFWADPCLGATGASAGACFNGDNLHPNNTGAIAMAAEASNKLNYDYGYTIGNPHSIAGSGTYTMGSEDGGLVVASTSANTTITLPSCLGVPEAVYTITNAQATNTVSFIGASASYPVNGLTTAIAIPSNTSVSVKAVTNATASAGCYWVQ